MLIYSPSTTSVVPRVALWRRAFAALVFWSIIKLLEGVHRGELDYYYCNPGQGVSLHHVHPAPASKVSAAVFLNDRRGDLSVLGEFFCVSDFNLENHISGHLFLSFKLTARKM